jgi:pSer/pThr/pTyr-binding forkhead associated (FHA) protein
MNPEGKGDDAVSIPAGAAVLVKNGFYEGLEVILEQESTVIGRGRRADIVIVEPTISREHASLGFDGERFFVQDLGSTNGTHVNGGRTSRQDLKDGDEIQIGKLVIGVTLPG